VELAGQNAVLEKLMLLCGGTNGDQEVLVNVYTYMCVCVCVCVCVCACVRPPALSWLASRL